MESRGLEIDIVTPTKKLVEGAPASRVRLPASEGEIEVLPGHADLLALLSTGILEFPTADGALSRRFAVSYGFVEVRGKRVVVLAETAEEDTGIDRARATKAKAKAEEALSGALSPEKFKKYQLKLQRALVRETLGKK